MVKALLIIGALALVCITYYLVAGLKISSHVHNLKLAITIDDLPAYGMVDTGPAPVEVSQKMLAAFKKWRVPEAYGFINARKVDNDSKLMAVLKLWTAAGYPLGNHTYSHQGLNSLSVAQYQEEIQKNEAVLDALVPEHVWKYFRYPDGQEGKTPAQRDAIRSYLKARGYKIAPFTVDFDDWAWNEPYLRCLNKGDAAAIAWLRRSYLHCARLALARQARIGQKAFGRQVNQILLLHMDAFTAEMLDDLLTQLTADGAKFTTLAEAQADPIYAIDTAYLGDTKLPFLRQVMSARRQGSSGAKDYPKNKLASLCR